MAWLLSGYDNFSQPVWSQSDPNDPSPPPFEPGSESVGVIMPLQGDPNSPLPTPDAVIVRTLAEVPVDPRVTILEGHRFFWDVDTGQLEYPPGLTQHEIHLLLDRYPTAGGGIPHPMDPEDPAQYCAFHDCGGGYLFGFLPVGTLSALATIPSAVFGGPVGMALSASQVAAASAQSEEAQIALTVVGVGVSVANLTGTDPVDAWLDFQTDVPPAGYTTPDVPAGALSNQAAVDAWLDFQTDVPPAGYTTPDVPAGALSAIPWKEASAALGVGKAGLGLVTALTGGSPAKATTGANARPVLANYRDNPGSLGGWYDSGPVADDPAPAVAASGPDPGGAGLLLGAAALGALLYTLMAR